MSCKIILILMLVGLLAIKTTNAQDLGELNKKIADALQAIAENNPESLSAVTEQVSSIAQQIMSAQGDPSKVTELIAQLTSVLANAEDPRNCGKLQNGKQYYIKSADGRYAVVQPDRQVAFMNLASTSPSKFTVVQKDCNLYAFYVNGYSMSRCENCESLLGDYQTVKFHVKDSNSAWSQWTLSAGSGVGLYNLKADNFGSLIYKRSKGGTAQLTLDPQLTDKSQFEFIEVVDNCGIILANGKQYYLKQFDSRYAVLDTAKNLAFMRFINQTDASKFTAVQKSCNVYGFCIGSACMSRCENCPSDTGDWQTVRFHLSNTDSSWSQWTLTSPAGQYGGPYSLTAEPEFGNLIFKTTLPNYEDQLSLEVTDDVYSWQKRFEFIEVK